MKDGDESLWGSDSSRETIERPQAKHVMCVAEGRSQQSPADWAGVERNRDWMQKGEKAIFKLHGGLSVLWMSP